MARGGEKRGYDVYYLRLMEEEGRERGSLYLVFEGTRKGGRGTVICVCFIEDTTKWEIEGKGGRGETWNEGKGMSYC